MVQFYYLLVQFLQAPPVIDHIIRQRQTLLARGLCAQYRKRLLTAGPVPRHDPVDLGFLVDIHDQNAWAIEAYMDLPWENKEGYEYGSSLRLADKLQAKLLAWINDQGPFLVSDDPGFDRRGPVGDVQCQVRSQ